MSVLRVRNVRAVRTTTCADTSKRFSAEILVGGKFQPWNEILVGYANERALEIPTPGTS